MKLRCGACKSPILCADAAATRVTCPACGKIWSVAKVPASASRRAIPPPLPKKKSQPAETQIAALNPGDTTKLLTSSDQSPPQKIKDSSPSTSSVALKSDQPPIVPAPSEPIAPVIEPKPEASRVRRWLRFVGSCSASCLFNIGILVLLGLIAVAVEHAGASAMIFESFGTQENAEAEYSLDADEFTLASEAPVAPIVASTSLGAVDAVGLLSPNFVEVPPREATRPQLPKFATVELPPASQLLAGIDDGSVAVGDEEGGYRVTGAVESAAAGIVREIKERSRDNNLLVVWLFDASNSLKKERMQAAKFLEPVLKELETKNSDRQLRHASVAFGITSKEMSSSSEESKRLIRGARAVPDDPTGFENTLAALAGSIKHFRKDWSDPIMVVIWTDEAGDDMENLEEAISICKQQNVSVSVVGANAVFGRSVGVQGIEINRKTYYLQVHKGPETALPERIALPMTRDDGDFPMYHFRADILNSGFAPYGLVRLARETGGNYLVFDREYKRIEFDLEKLADYVPDYRSADVIEAEIEQYPLRAAVIQAARVTMKLETARLPRHYFFRDVNPPYPRILYPPSEFQRRLVVALREEAGHVEVIAGAIESGIAAMSGPEVAAAFEKESPRWRANYDLAMGELLVGSVFYREYQLLYEDIALRLRSDTANIELGPGGPMRSGQWGKERLLAAKKHLDRCSSEHVGTPWAMAAKLVQISASGVRVIETPYVYIPATGGSVGGSGGGGPSLPKL